MMITRRTLMQSALAAGAALAVPSALRAQDKETVRMIMGDVQVFDPVFTSSGYTINHAMAIYDTLFAMDANSVPQPQMVDRWHMSDDKRTYTFELRNDLKWHDGTPVSAADCVASIRRWSQVVPSGQLLLQRAESIIATDNKTFVIKLKEPLGSVIDILAATGQPLFMMRERDAKLPATEQVTANIGSGPYRFNAELTKPGSRIVYDRNEQYVPRSEPSSGLAGGKIVKVERVISENISDAQTALAALQAGEVDFWMEPVPDLFPAIQGDPGLVLDTLGRQGSDWLVRMNFLQPPFNNVKVRQALLHLIDQKAFMSLLSPDPEFGRTVTSTFGTGSQFSNDVNTGWFKEGGNPSKAKQLIADSGYAGEKVVVLSPTDWPQGNMASQLLVSVLKKAGINAELASMTWNELAVRRNSKAPVEEGGWSIFITYFNDSEIGNPMSSNLLLLNGEKAWYGWPQNDEYEALRNKWPDLATSDERKTLAADLQRIWWDYVPIVYLCQTAVPAARSKSLVDMIDVPWAEVPIWNMRKV